MREEVDVVRAVKRHHTSMQTASRLVVHDVSRLHHDLMQPPGEVVDLNAPRLLDTPCGERIGSSIPEEYTGVWGLNVV